LINKLLEKIVSDQNLHQRWLYTIGYLENCGAKKILHFQNFKHPTLEILKHAHEETRHAFFFRKQIASLEGNPDLERNLCGGLKAKNFLDRLDIAIMKCLRDEFNPPKNDLIFYSYLLTTYAIEVRADKLFGLYEKVLRSANSPITLTSIIKEEANHLFEIEKEISKIEFLAPFKEFSCNIENALFNSFIGEVEKEFNIGA
jgi:hypothetical protein